jgi:sulfite exporter TauE/SafE
VLRRLRFAYRLVSFGEMRLLRLIARKPGSAETHLEEMAQWQLDRLMNTAKACVGTGVGFLLGLLTTQFKDTLAANHGILGVAVVFNAVLIAFGLGVYARLRRFNQLYVEALEKLRKLCT